MQSSSSAKRKPDSEFAGSAHKLRKESKQSKPLERAPDPESDLPGLKAVLGQHLPDVLVRMVADYTPREQAALQAERIHGALKELGLLEGLKDPTYLLEYARSLREDRNPIRDDEIEAVTNTVFLCMRGAPRDPLEMMRFECMHEELDRFLAMIRNDEQPDVIEVHPPDNPLEAFFAQHFAERRERERGSFDVSKNKATAILATMHKDALARGARHAGLFKEIGDLLKSADVHSYADTSMRIFPLWRSLSTVTDFAGALCCAALSGLSAQERLQHRDNVTRQCRQIAECTRDMKNCVFGPD